MSELIKPEINSKQVIPDFKKYLKTIEESRLESLEFAIESFPKMPNQVLGSNRMDRKYIDANLVVWLIQQELDRRQADGLPYSHEDLYSALKIPDGFITT